MKETADDSATKSYMEKNNLHYFTFFLNSVRPIKAVIRHLPPDTPVEDISNGLGRSGFIVINVRKMKVNRTASAGKLHMKPLLLFLLTLKRNIKSQEIFKLNSVKKIAI
jgi:hypothetical protein